MPFTVLGTVRGFCGVREDLDLSGPETMSNIIGLFQSINLSLPIFISICSFPGIFLIIISYSHPVCIFLDACFELTWHMACQQGVSVCRRKPTKQTDAVPASPVDWWQALLHGWICASAWEGWEC